MKIDELVQSYKNGPTFSFLEVIQASLGDWEFYVICAFLLVFLLFFFVILSEPSEFGLLSLLMITGILFAMYGLSHSTFNEKKDALQKEFNIEWNNKHIATFLQQQHWKKAEVTQVTFQGKEQPLSFKEETNKDGYAFKGFLRSEDGELTEEEFVADRLKDDLQKGEKPYIEFKYLPKTLNKQAKQGRYYVTFHVNEKELKEILQK